MTIIITGASKGIGKYIFENFLAKEYDVYGTYLNNTPKINIEKYYKVDVTDFNQVLEWSNCIKLSKKIILINCAAINYNCAFHKSDINQWYNVIQTNLYGTVNTTLAFLPKMRINNFGRIILFSSVIAQMGVFGTSAYATSKAALWGFAKSIMVENAKLGIHINTINLGYTNLGMVSEVPNAYLNNIQKLIPQNTLCDGDEIMKVVNYLIDSNYLNGSEINLNGGLR